MSRNRLYLIISGLYGIIFMLVNFVLLSPMYAYPDIYDQAPLEILKAFSANQTTISLIYTLMSIVTLSLVFTWIKLMDYFGLKGVKVKIANMLFIAAGLMQVLGNLGYLFGMNYLANRPTLNIQMTESYLQILNSVFATFITDLMWYMPFGLALVLYSMCLHYKKIYSAPMYIFGVFAGLANVVLNFSYFEVPGLVPEWGNLIAHPTLYLFLFVNIIVLWKKVK